MSTDELAKTEASHRMNAEAELTVAAASHAASTALQAGARAPLFNLIDEAGHAASLEDLLRKGPVVLHFFRGAWCTFGEESLGEFAKSYQDVVELGASAVAIAPPNDAQGSTTSLPMRELVDVGMKVARAYGLAFDLPTGLRSKYLALGYVPPPPKKAGEWLVPIPATYLIGSDGVIVLAFVDVDYRNQFDYSSLLAALRALQARRTTRRSGDGFRL